MFMIFQSISDIVNVYIVYDLDNWPKNCLRIFSLKNGLFEATIYYKKVIKKSMYVVDMEQYLNLTIKRLIY